MALNRSVLAFVVAWAFTTAAFAGRAEATSAEAPQQGKLSLMTMVPQLTPVSDYSGDFWNRPVLFGDVEGDRQKFYEKGVAIDVEMTHVAQGVVSGGKEKEWKYSGAADYYLALDSGRLGLWPGGLLTVHGRNKFGNGVNPQAGTISPINFAYLYPVSGQESEAFLEEYYVTQGLTDWLSFVGGRLFLGNTADTNRFANDEKTQFLNTSLRNSPLLGIITSSLSGHAVALQIQPIPNIAIIPFAISRNDKDGVYGSPGGLFSEYSTGASMILNWKVAGLPGEFLPLGGYSSKDVVDLDNPFEPGDILRDRILGIQIPKKDDNWVVGFSADQYFYAPEATSSPDVHTAAFDKEPEGLGTFLRFYYGPDDRNPWNIFVSGGVGGRGVIPSRSLDRYGLGFYSLIVSDKLDNRALLGKLDTEWGMEVFYNFAITPWLQVSPDLQYVQSGRPRVDDALILGTRVQMYF